MSGAAARIPGDYMSETETWIELDDADVMPANSAERASIAAVKGGDDLQAICDQVTEQIREAYRSGGRPMGDDGTIPASQKMRAIAIALWRFVSEGVAKNEGIQTKQREAAATEAQTYLVRVATREIKGSGSAQIVSGNRRQATRRTLGSL